MRAKSSENISIRIYIGQCRTHPNKMDPTEAEDDHRLTKNQSQDGKG